MPRRQLKQLQTKNTNFMKAFKDHGEAHTPHFIKQKFKVVENAANISGLHGRQFVEPGSRSVNASLVFS